MGALRALRELGVGDLAALTERVRVLMTGVGTKRHVASATRNHVNDNYSNCDVLNL